MTSKSKAQEKQRMCEIDENISKLFDIKKRLGKGAYGIVWKALDKRNNVVAVKKIFDAFRDETDAQRTFREIVFLKAFRTHPNIVKLHNVYKATNNLDIYLIFEYMDSDLHNIIKKGTILKDVHKRYVMYQLINAIKYIHSGNVIHRDLKPSNVLIDSKCRCKLADFGLARSVANRTTRSENGDLGSEISAQQALLTDYVATRWYRAPEILVASKKYTKGIDMWSLGCILGEMIRGKPLFQGSSTVDQIEKILSTLPDITERDVKSVGAGFGSVLLTKQISKDRRTTLNDILCDASKDALDLVKSLLVLDPCGRLTANEALEHPYVEKFRNSIPEIELHVDVLPPFRDDIRLTVPEYRSKLYEIVRIPCESVKNSGMRNGDSAKVHNTKLREHRSLSTLTEKCTTKNKLTKPKLINPSLIFENNHATLKDKSLNKNEKLDGVQSQEQATNLSTIINRAFKKSSNHSKTKANAHDREANCEQAQNQQSKYIDSSVIHERNHHISNRSKSLSYNPQPPRTPAAQHIGDRLKPSSAMHHIDIKRHSIDGGGGGDCITNDQSALKKFTNNNNNNCSQRMYRNSSQSIGKCAKEIVQDKSSEYRRTPTMSKSEIISSSVNDSNFKVQERICYEKRIKRLEEDIERYKNDVRTFFKDNVKFANAPKDCEDTLEEHAVISRSKSNYRSSSAVKNKLSTPKKTLNVTTNPNTPIKNTYFQLLTKGNHFEKKKSDLDLSGKNSQSDNSDRHIGKPLLKQQYLDANSNTYPSHHHHHQHNHHRSRTLTKLV